LNAVFLPEGQLAVQVPHWKQRFSVSPPLSMTWLANSGLGTFAHM
jgi:hypothetical protein